MRAPLTVECNQVMGGKFKKYTIVGSLNQASDWMNESFAGSITLYVKTKDYM